MGLHFKVMAGSVIVVPVMVNGRGPYDFVFDTGNESTLIDTDLAQQVGVTAVDRMWLESSTGSAVLARAFAGEISLGPARVRDSEVLISPLQSVHSVSRRIRGIIGQSFLRHFDYILDNAHSSIQIVGDDDIRKIKGTRVNFARSRSRPLLPVKIGRSQLDFVLDSGASNVVVYSHAQNPALSCRTQICAAEMRSSSAATWVSTAQIGAIEVAGHRFRSQEAAVMNDIPNQQADGLLPTRLFRTIYFSNSGGYVVLVHAR